jgi:glycerol-3-phosphate O-acyltransferase
VNPKDKQRVVVEVVQRVLDLVGTQPQALESAIFDTLYEERRRLETEPDRALAHEQAAFYERIHASALHADPTRQRDLLREIVRGFVEEVAGHFDPRVYALSTRVVPTGLSLLLNAMSPMKLAAAVPRGFGNLGDQLEIGGEVAALKRCADLGTVVLVPTHSSNLDSILLGFALFKMGLPPFLYGAGLNLFHNKLIGFFMHNLGAYKVDRRKKAALYKDVLKTYAGYSIELGYDNLFFPGGTRSRSGSVESRLKLGLLGMGLNAYVHNLIARKPSPDIFVVPCTLNYELVLEAGTLIEDHLKEAGKSRYIIEDDEFSRPKLVFDFVKKLFSLDSRIHMVIGRPLDPFGNEVDAGGRSRDARGRPVDRARYVMRDGSPVLDRQRDEEYTRELAQAVVRSFQRNTMVRATHLLARVVFDWLRERARGMDLYRLLRTGGPDESLPITQAYERVAVALGAVQRLAASGEILLDRVLESRDEVRVAGHALTLLGSYHRRPALERRGDRLFHNDRNLLLYYQNRLDGRALAPAGAS